ncbi:M15 family metallopeptidase [Acinetobacter sp. ANC 3813]|uniref:M15 family metallopeptidase n=1 Tax=Acinetobacter sp. ANC 3813 TaxID=1977873 RepID=UPI000A357375|nr:M15 family metallopeptidase [Acinetobacter sp. ANC 3813]OTG91415.1 D-alanyl-D-alanine carboxypeptidase [Acinetobacter sp. ANC 3813]
MISFLACSFILLTFSMALLISYEFREKLRLYFHDGISQFKSKLFSAKQFAHQMNEAASPDQIQSHWHLQQWWILIAGFFLFSSILLYAFTRPITASSIEADYLKKTDPQIYAMLEGQILDVPQELDESLVQEAVNDAIALENNTASIAAAHISPVLHINTDDEDLVEHQHSDIASADRKWNKINPRYKQRLLMVFKIMREQHGYEMVLLEGYRSPDRQNTLAQNVNTTRARGYQSYHQFGLAADVAFKRNDKVVISERDPWAMRGYELYGQTAETVGLTWGGRWKSLQDYGHTEYRMPGLKKTREMAEQLTSEGQLQARQMSIKAAAHMP